MNLARAAAAMALWLPFATSASEAALPAPAVERLGTLVRHEHEAGRFDGVVLVGSGDAVVCRQAIGWADRERGIAHHSGEVWRWASVSKQVTALLVMQQVERGPLGLDDRLDRLVPEFGSPLSSEITLRHLLQHTSGLPNPDATKPTGAGDEVVPPYYATRFADERGPMTTALAYCAGEPVGTPGERFAYNNCDTLVVQAVLERVTGTTYAELLARAVSRPLGLGQVGLLPAATGAPAAATPVGYLDGQRTAPFFNLASLGAGGAIHGTADDLWEFDRALIQHRLLGAAATATMWRGEPRLGQVALGAWSFQARLAGCPAAVTLVERHGGIEGLQVRNIIAPELGKALIVFSNSSATEFGEIWQGKGLAHDLAAAAFCAA